MPTATLRNHRVRLGLTQREFAGQLDINTETYRVLDSGRRPSPPQLLERAELLSKYANADGLLPLSILAPLIGVHVRTLWNAAAAGRLEVTRDTRTTFRQLRSLATLADARIFKERFYRTKVRPLQRPERLKWADIPADYHLRIKAMRNDLGLSQAQLAKRIGAARKAVIYQWESRKRCPSPVF